MRASDAAGCTCSDVPMTTKVSAVRAISMTRPSSSSSRAFAEHDGRGLHDAAACGAGWVGFAGVHPVDDGPRRGALTAVDAQRVEHVAMQLEHPLGRRAGPLVQPVDVLRDDPRVGDARDRGVCRVRLGGHAGLASRNSQERRRISGSVTQ